MYNIAKVKCGADRFDIIEKMAKGKAGRIVRKCTNVNPDERYQTAEKLANIL